MTGTARELLRVRQLKRALRTAARRCRLNVRRHNQPAAFPRRMARLVAELRNRLFRLRENEEEENEEEENEEEENEEEEA